ARAGVGPGLPPLGAGGWAAVGPGGCGRLVGTLLTNRCDRPGPHEGFPRHDVMPGPVLRGLTMRKRDKQRMYRCWLGGFIAPVTLGGFFLYGSLTEGADLDVHTGRAVLLSVALGTTLVLLAGSSLILRLAVRNGRSGNPAGE